MGKHPKKNLPLWKNDITTTKAASQNKIPTPINIIKNRKEAGW